jgi:hypothetical protein
MRRVVRGGGAGDESPSRRRHRLSHLAPQVGTRELVLLGTSDRTTVDRLSGVFPKRSGDDSGSAKPERIDAMDSVARVLAQIPPRGQGKAQT